MRPSVLPGLNHANNEGPIRDPVKEASDRQLAKFNSQMEANQRKQDAVFNRPAKDHFLPILAAAWNQSVANNAGLQRWIAGRLG
ncbi:MAG: hypothetical protein ON057_001878 [Glomeribacter sp. 1016415]|nr:hypothetical protein [Glomeribacter sp. 1016415]